MDAAHGEGGAQGGSRVLPAAHRARHDGAAERDGTHRRRSLRSMGADAGAAGDARRRGEAPRPAVREGHRARHAARRRLRPQVQARLRHRGRAPVAADGRPAGESRLDARRRSASRLLPHRFGRSACRRGSMRRARPPRGCIAARRPPSSRPSRRIRSTRRRSSWAWGWSTCPSRFRTCAWRIPPAAAHTRIGWFRSVSNVPHAFAVQSFVAELAAAAGRDHRDYPARPHRAGPAHRSGRAAGLVESRRVAAALSIRYRQAAPRDRDS